MVKGINSLFLTYQVDQKTLQTGSAPFLLG